MSVDAASETSVQVAVRIRPQNSREQIDMCQMCTSCTAGQPHIVLGKDKAFTYDYVFDTGSQQEEIYGACVEKLVEGCFDGYNATVLAYGQTGSGKTYTMGTGFDMLLPEQQGMIPRAVLHIFNGMEARRESAREKGELAPMFEVTAQFMELYNEDLIDLFDASGTSRKLRIHEDPVGGIYIPGVTMQKVESEDETLDCLKRGALSRTVGSTNMNSQSSRSHAIFTLIISQQRPCSAPPGGDGDATSLTPPLAAEDDWESLSSKFHFVDLAGSERLKRTGATGDRAKEGISINCGLLALGNVISALGDKTKRGCHVPYRDSKLTRLLQDSLGGNSQTLMIACISPTDRDFMETLNSLKYANRARNIKNKVVVNQDKASQLLSGLRTKIQQLEVELQGFRSGRMAVGEDGSVVMTDMAHEITMLRTENDKLRLRVKALQQVIDSQSERLALLSAQRDSTMLSRPDESTGQVVSTEGEQQMAGVLHGYLKQIEDLKGQLVMSESLSRQNPGSPFRRAPSSVLSRAASTLPLPQETEELLRVVRDDIQRLREKEERKKKHHSPLHERVIAVVPDRHSVSSQDGVGGEGPMPFEEDSDEETNSSNEDDSAGSDECSDSSDDSDLDDAASLASTIADLTSEINLKQQLVEQLEKSQRSMSVLKQQYEEKMEILQQQIKSVESERDKVLKDMTSRRGGAAPSGAKEASRRYEKELQSLRTELKRLKAIRKEHARAMKKNVDNEGQLKQLRGDLLDMKKQKVKLMNQMRADATHRKADDARKAREVAVLKKDTRKKEHKIKLLESDARKRELVLKRRQEQLLSLRKQARLPPATVGAAPAPVLAHSFSCPKFEPVARLATSGSHEFVRGSASRDKLSRRKSSVYSSDGARKKWREMERKIVDTVMRRQTMAVLAKDMDRWIEKRDELSRRREDLRRQKELALQGDSVDMEEVSSINEDLDSIAANIEYVQSNIVELQNDLIAVDDTKSDGDTLEAHSLIMSCNPREAKYLLEHLLDMVLDLGVKAERKELEVRSLESRLEASEQNAELIKTFTSPQIMSQPIVVNLQTVTKQKKGSAKLRPPVPSLNLDATDERSDSASGSTSQSQLLGSVKSKPQLIDSVKSKLRRRTGLPSELAAHRGRSPSSRPTSANAEQLLDPETPDGVGSSPQPFRRKGSASSMEPIRRRALKAKSATCSSLDNPTQMPSSTVARPPSPSPSTSSSSSSSSSSSALAKLGGSNVWARLSGSAHGSSNDSGKGSFQPERDSKRTSARLLTLTHTASGHAGSVLSVCTAQNLLFSASQDRTAKVWDLKSGMEVQTLEKHLSYVRVIRYSQAKRLVFTACQSMIKIWDTRNYRSKCIKTFGPPSGSGSSGDVVVQDLYVSPSGDTLFSAAGNVVNVWDLRRFMHCGRFVGHNGAISTLIVRDNLMMTGSRDRSIKLYDLDGTNTAECTNISQAPMVTLFPLHYDAVTCFAAHKNLLFSACGLSIKQWDFRAHSLRHTVDGAHTQGNTINSMGVFSSSSSTSLSSSSSSLLLSGCKGGMLKLWNPETCDNIGEVTAHKQSINTITTNDSLVFTGSSDKTIKIWRPLLFQD